MKLSVSLLLLDLEQLAGLLRRVTSSSQGCTQTQKNAHRTQTPNIYVRSRIKTQDHSVRAREDSSCRRILGYRKSYLFIFSTHFWHSYAGGKLKHAYTGIFFCKVPVHKVWHTLVCGVDGTLESSVFLQGNPPGMHALSMQIYANCNVLAKQSVCT
jgi:hypothetical protein